jgi:hypothetical protein
VNMVKSEVILTLKQKTADVKSLELEVRTRFSRPRLWPSGRDSRTRVEDSIEAELWLSIIQRA